MSYIHKGAYIAVLVFCIVIMSAYSSSATVRISIIKSNGSDAHNEAIASFVRAITGFGRSYTYNTITIKEGAESEIIKETKGSDLILSMGTTATLAAKKVIKNTPIVFCMVLNPVSSGIARNMESPGGNITGASLDIPLKSQFEYIKLLIANVKTVGVMYSPQETRTMVQEAFGIARSMNLSLVAKPISSEREVPDALKSLLSKIDVLWSVADGTVFGAQSTQYILLNTLKAEVPFIGLSPSFVKAGALMALSCNNGDIGKQAAEIANRVLNGENPGNIAIAVPREISMWINLRTADQLGLRIPDHIIKSADKVIK